MSRVFVDTSAIYAAIIEGDSNHGSARAGLVSLRKEKALLVTSSFVVQESITLLQRRSGMQSVRIFCAKFMPSLEIVYVDQALLHQSVQALLAASRRRVSLTDWVSITLMRETGIQKALAFDKHFQEQGFDQVV